MKLIPLTQDQFAMVDDEDFEKVNELKWRAIKDGRLSTIKFYALSGRYIKKIQQQIRMHSYIIGMAPFGMMIDHINGNGLDNTRCNLRFATRSQNGANSIKCKNKTSRFKGVCWNKLFNIFQAAITVDGDILYLGRSKDELLLAKRYDMAAIYFFEDCARPNFKR